MKYTLQPFLSTVRAILIPSPIQAASALAAATLVFLCISFDRIFHLMVQDDPESRYYFYQMVSDALRDLSDLPRAADLSVMTVWALTGTAAYIVIASLARLLLKLKDTVVTESGGRNKNPLFSLVDEYRRAVWIFFFILFVGASLLFLFEYWLSLMELDNGIIAVRLLLAVAGLAANLYLLAMLIAAVKINPYLIQPSKDVIHK